MRRHLLVIGAQRSGTTYLTTLLESHPDIAMARPSRPEPKVFCSDERSVKGLTWYRDTYFAHATTESLLGEKSTSYLEDPGAASRASAVLGRAEIVVLVRDPVLRAISNWRFSTDNGFEDRSLEDALTDNLEHRRDWDEATTSVSPFAYLERGRYSDYLPPWYGAFPHTLHIQLLPDLVADPRAVRPLFAALGVDETFVPPVEGGPVNQSETDAPELSPELLESLRDYFADSDEALRDRLGRELPWPVSCARPG